MDKKLRVAKKVISRLPACFPIMSALKENVHLKVKLSIRYCEAVSIKHGLRTADYGLRTGYKIRTRYKTRTGKYGLGIKHGLGIKRGLGIKYGLRTTLVKTVLIGSR